jgi:hypothetical protein
MQRRAFAGYFRQFSRKFFRGYGNDVDVRRRARRAVDLRDDEPAQYFQCGLFAKRFIDFLKE